MVSYSQVLTKGVWFEVANAVDYALQNRSGSDIPILVKLSDTTPTSTVGAFSLRNGDGVSSANLPGRVWATTLDEKATIAYAK